MSEFSQGVMGDGAAILRDGVLVTIDEVVRLLNAYVDLQKQMDTLSAVARTGTVESIVNSKSLEKIVALMLRDNKEMHDKVEKQTTRSNVRTLSVFSCSFGCQLPSHMPDCPFYKQPQNGGGQS